MVRLGPIHGQLNLHGGIFSSSSKHIENMDLTKKAKSG